MSSIRAYDYSDLIPYTEDELRMIKEKGLRDTRKILSKCSSCGEMNLVIAEDEGDGDYSFPFDPKCDKCGAELKTFHCATCEEFKQTVIDKYKK